MALSQHAILTIPLSEMTVQQVRTTVDSPHVWVLLRLAEFQFGPKETKTEAEWMAALGFSVIRDIAQHEEEAITVGAMAKYMENWSQNGPAVDITVIDGPSVPFLQSSVFAACQRIILGDLCQVIAEYAETCTVELTMTLHAKKAVAKA